MDEPLVTVVVISYNQGKYIRENLDSVKAQTYDNIQLIVADDASTDNSVEIFDNWLFKNNYRAEKNYHQKNTGLSTILNECFELIKGKYVKFIAADDYLHPSAIEKCVEKLEESGSDYGMVFTDTYCINENSAIQKDIDNYDFVGNLERESFRKELLKGNKIAALTVVMRTSVLKETGQYNSELLVEDYFRWLKISEKYFIAYVPEKLAYYRLHNDNISKTKEERIGQEAFFLSIIFDKKGYNKDRINQFVKEIYLSNKQIDIRLKNAYLQYPYRIKRIGWAFKFKIPLVIFHLLNK